MAHNPVTPVDRFQHRPHQKPRAPHTLKVAAQQCFWLAAQLRYDTLELYAYYSPPPYFHLLRRRKASEPGGVQLSKIRGGNTPGSTASLIRISLYIRPTA